MMYSFKSNSLNCFLLLQSSQFYKRKTFFHRYVHYDKATIIKIKNASKNKEVGAVDKDHRMTVTLLDKEEKNVNSRQQECFVFQCFDGPAADLICYSAKSHIIIIEEGNREGFFYQEDVDKAEMRDDEAAFAEPKIKWRHSKAKFLLNKAIIDGKVPEQPTDNYGNPTMDLDEIYNMYQEFTK